MRIVIIGGGKVGSTIAEHLTKEGHDIVVIDHDKRVVERIGDQLDVMALCGSGASVEVMRQAGVEESDLLIACTAQDELNLISCVFAKKLGCANTIARVRSPEYAQSVYLLSDSIGLSMVINPEYNAAQEIFRLLEIPSVFKRDTFAGGRVEIVELQLREGDQLDGVPLYELPKKLKLRALICAVQRGEDIQIPDGRFVLQAGDKIYLCAPATSIARILQNLGLYKRMVRRVMLVGGSRIAEYLTRMLAKTGAATKIVEMDMNRARRLAEELPEADVVCADGTSDAVLRAENVEQMDSVVTLTNIDEENLILSMYVSRLGVPQVITKVDHTEFGAMLMDRGIDRVISPKKLCAHAIIRYVRAMQNTGGSAVLTLHHLVDGKVGALEFAVTEHTKNRGRTLRDIQLKPNILVASINKNGQILIPGGDDTFDTGDTVVIVTTSKQVILDLNDVFAEEV